MSYHKKPYCEKRHCTVQESEQLRQEIEELEDALILHSRFQRANDNNSVTGRGLIRQELGGGRSHWQHGGQGKLTTYRGNGDLLESDSQGNGVDSKKTRRTHRPHTISSTRDRGGEGRHGRDKKGSVSPVKTPDKRKREREERPPMSSKREVEKGNKPVLEITCLNSDLARMISEREKSETVGNVEVEVRDGRHKLKQKSPALQQENSSMRGVCVELREEVREKRVRQSSEHKRKTSPNTPDISSRSHTDSSQGQQLGKPDHKVMSLRNISPQLNFDTRVESQSPYHGRKGKQQRSDWHRKEDNQSASKDTRAKQIKQVKRKERPEHELKRDMTVSQHKPELKCDMTSSWHCQATCSQGSTTEAMNQNLVNDFEEAEVKHKHNVLSSERDLAVLDTCKYLSQVEASELMKQRSHVGARDVLYYKEGGEGEGEHNILNSLRGAYHSGSSSTATLSHQIPAMPATASGTKCLLSRSEVLSDSSLASQFSDLGLISAPGMTATRVVSHASSSMSAQKASDMQMLEISDPVFEHGVASHMTCRNSLAVDGSKSSTENCNRVITSIHNSVIKDRRKSGISETSAQRRKLRAGISTRARWKEASGDADYTNLTDRPAVKEEETQDLFVASYKLQSKQSGSADRQLASAKAKGKCTGSKLTRKPPASKKVHTQGMSLVARKCSMKEPLTQVKEQTKEKTTAQPKETMGDERVNGRSASVDRERRRGQRSCMERFASFTTVRSVKNMREGSEGSDRCPKRPDTKCIRELPTQLRNDQTQSADQGDESKKQLVFLLADMDQGHWSSPRSVNLNESYLSRSLSEDWSSPYAPHRERTVVREGGKQRSSSEWGMHIGSDGHVVLSPSLLADENIHMMTMRSRSAESTSQEVVKDESSICPHLSPSKLSCVCDGERDEFSDKLPADDIWVMGTNVRHQAGVSEDMASASFISSVSHPQVAASSRKLHTTIPASRSRRGEVKSTSGTILQGNSQARLSETGALFNYHSNNIKKVELVRAHICYSGTDLLGDGAFSQVFRGKYQGSEVAIKRLRAPVQARDKNYFTAEVCLLHELCHPNVVKLLGVSTSPDCLPLIVLELMAGGSLYTLLHVSRLGLDRDKYFLISQDVTSGMLYLHQHQPPVLHLDLSSKNILIDHQTRAKVADFGFSKLKCESNVRTYRSRKSQVIQAATAWMAPELLSSGEVTVKADVYSFGVVLWEMFTQQVPYEDCTVFQVLENLRLNRRPSIPDNCPADLALLIEKCWDQNPAARPGFKDVWSCLEQITDGREWRVQAATAILEEDHMDIPVASPSASKSENLEKLDSTRYLTEKYLPAWSCHTARKSCDTRPSQPQQEKLLPLRESQEKPKTPLLLSQHVSATQVGDKQAAATQGFEHVQVKDKLGESKDYYCEKLAVSKTDPCEELTIKRTNSCENVTIHGTDSCKKLIISETNSRPNHQLVNVSQNSSTDPLGEVMGQCTPVSSGQFYTARGRDRRSLSNTKRCLDSSSTVKYDKETLYNNNGAQSARLSTRSPFETPPCSTNFSLDIPPEVWKMVPGMSATQGMSTKSSSDAKSMQILTVHPEHIIDGPFSSEGNNTETSDDIFCPGHFPVTTEIQCGLSDYQSVCQDVHKSGQELSSVDDVAKHVDLLYPSLGVTSIHVASLDVDNQKLTEDKVFDYKHGQDRVIGYMNHQDRKVGHKDCQVKEVGYGNYHDKVFGCGDHQDRVVSYGDHQDRMLHPREQWEPQFLITAGNDEADSSVSLHPDVKSCVRDELSSLRHMSISDDQVASSTSSSPAMTCFSLATPVSSGDLLAPSLLSNHFRIPDENLTILNTQPESDADKVSSQRPEFQIQDYDSDRGSSVTPDDMSEDSLGIDEDDQDKETEQIIGDMTGKNIMVSHSAKTSVAWSDSPGRCELSGEGTGLPLNSQKRHNKNISTYKKNNKSYVLYGNLGLSQTYYELMNNYSKEAGRNEQIVTDSSKLNQQRMEEEGQLLPYLTISTTTNSCPQPTLASHHSVTNEQKAQRQDGFSKSYTNTTCSLEPFLLPPRELPDKVRSWTGLSQVDEVTMKDLEEKHCDNTLYSEDLDSRCGKNNKCTEKSTCANKHSPSVDCPVPCKNSVEPTKIIEFTPSKEKKQLKPAVLASAIDNCDGTGIQRNPCFSVEAGMLVAQKQRLRSVVTQMHPVDKTHKEIGEESMPSVVSILKKAMTDRRFAMRGDHESQDLTPDASWSVQDEE